MAVPSHVVASEDAAECVIVLETIIVIDKYYNLLRLLASHWKAHRSGGKLNRLAARLYR